MNVGIELVFNAEEGKVLTIVDILADLKQTGTLYEIFQMVSEEIQQKNPTGLPGHFKVQYTVEGLSVCGALISEVGFSAGIKTIIQDLEVPSVVAYDAPEVKSTERGVLIEKVAIGDFEITQSSNRVFVAIDLTPVKCPPNSQFKYLNFDFGREISMEKIEIIGIPRFMIPIEKITLGLRIKD